ncbi:MAG: LysM peptidoglycan-binding domain-containing protein [Desulfobacteraceae bacterium]|nr:LysM peptidoglycan-binding domain-containing protein [Desulfobacteraceae bacterium]
MKPKGKPGSKISTTQTNTNQKKNPKSPESMDLGNSLLKKNEFTLIIAGALVVTIIVFFVFFKGSGPKTEALPDSSSTGESGGSFIELEKRIKAIESALKKFQAEDSLTPGGLPATPAELAPLQQKVQRLETSASVKFDSLTERMGKMEKQIRVLNKRSSTVSTAKVAAPAKAPQKAPTKTLVKKKAVVPAKKVSIFHTVQKGETLWSISQKYKISVANLRKLNNMSSNATIYPGTNILVR